MIKTGETFEATPISPINFVGELLPRHIAFGRPFVCDKVQIYNGKPNAVISGKFKFMSTRFTFKRID